MKKLLALVAALAALTLGFAAPASAQDDARIHLIHGIPDTDVDVFVDGEAVISGFSFGDTQDLSGFAGETLTDLQVRLAGTEDVAIDAGDTPLPATGNYTVIAHLDADGTPTLGVFENDTSTTAAGEGRLVVRHTAAAPAVDVLAGDAPVITNLANGSGEALDLAAGPVSASVVPTGATEPVVIGPADLPVSEGSSLIVYAVGSLDGETLGVLTETIDGLASTPTEIPTGTAPVSSSNGLGLVSVFGAAFVALGCLALGRTLAPAKARV